MDLIKNARFCKGNFTLSYDRTKLKEVKKETISIITNLIRSKYVSLVKAKSPCTSLNKSNLNVVCAPASVNTTMSRMM